MELILTEMNRSHLNRGGIAFNFHRPVINMSSNDNPGVSDGEFWSKLDRGMVVVQPTHARAVFFVQGLDSLAVHVHQFGLLQWQWLEGTCSGDDRAGWHDPA